MSKPTPNPFCRIQYMLDENNKVIGIETNGDADEAAAMATYFLGSIVGIGEASLFSVISNIARVANKTYTTTKGTGGESQ